MRVTSKIAFALSLLVLATTVTPAAAASPAREAERLTQQLAQAADPTAAFFALGAREQKAVIDYTTAVSFSTDERLVSQAANSDGSSVAAAATRCWTWTWGRVGRNVFGVTVWEFHQQIDWCGDGTKITNTPFRRVYPAKLALWWSYEGLVASTTAGGKGSATYRSYVMGHMRYRPPTPWLNQDNYPWLDMTAHADGRGTGSGGN